MTLSRRALLLGAAAVTATAAGSAVAVDRRMPQRLLDRVDPPRYDVPAAAPGQLVDGAFRSSARGRDVRWALAYPPGHAPGSRLPVALVLHGRGDDSRAAFGPHALHRFLAAATRSGAAPYALAAVDGGDTYWHRRANGDDPQAMLLDELLPMLAARGLRTERFGLTGWSMGGYGALLLAAAVPQRVSAMAVEAPALWRRPGDTARGAFDSPDDFAKHDVFRRLEALRRVPVRIACGRSDPFYAADRALVDALPHAESDFPRGGHDLACWNGVRPAQLRFLAEHAETGSA